MDTPQDRRRLTREDWARAALTAIGRGGLAAVAVEPLAAELGATKGSFYWHFANRDALIAAALELWEERYTAATIAMLSAEPDPVVRLRQLMTNVLTLGGGGRTEINLLAAIDHPLVGPVARRVTERRLGYVVDLFVAAGFSRPEAERRGLLGYTLYVGNQELAARLPHTLPPPRSPEFQRYVAEIMELLLARPRPADEPADRPVDRPTD